MDKNHHVEASMDQGYSCVMHPEVKGNKGDKCPKCGMELIPSIKEASNEVIVNLSTVPENAKAEDKTKIIIKITEHDKVIPIEIAHEKKVHLMLVDESLTWFSHLHPEEVSDGSYVVEEEFPYGGKSFAYVDFKPEGLAPQVQKIEIEISGNPAAKGENSKNKLTSQVGGYTVSLLNGNDFKTNRTQELNISVEKDGKVLEEKNMQPYLGASAHIVMIGQSDKDFLHIHPVSDARFSLYAQTYIEKSDSYRMWVQFQIDGQIHVADFTVNVDAGEINNSHDKHHSHGH